MNGCTWLRIQPRQKSSTDCWASLHNFLTGLLLISSTVYWVGSCATPGFLPSRKRGPHVVQLGIPGPCPGPRLITLGEAPSPVKLCERGCHISKLHDQKNRPLWGERPAWRSPPGRREKSYLHRRRRIGRSRRCGRRRFRRSGRACRGCRASRGVRH